LCGDGFQAIRMQADKRRQVPLSIALPLTSGQPFLFFVAIAVLLRKESGN
jgi:hypothetical protein